MPRATIVAKLGYPLISIYSNRESQGIPGNPMKSKENAPLYWELFLQLIFNNKTEQYAFE